VSVYRGTLAWRQRVKRSAEHSPLGSGVSWVGALLGQTRCTWTVSVYRGTLACRRRVKRSAARDTPLGSGVGWVGALLGQTRSFLDGERVPGDPSLAATG
jgi:hypothetical protein